MRIGVIGAGGVGGAFATALSRAGHDIAIAARPSTAEAIRMHGLRLSGAFGTETQRVSSASTVLPSGLDLAIIATKAHDAPVALEENRAPLRDVPLVVMQNGLSGIDAAATALRREHAIYGALTLFAATNRGEGRVHITAVGDTYLGAGDAAPTQEAIEIAATLNEGLPTSAIDNFEGACWTKLLINQVNAIPAVTDMSVQEVSADPITCRILARSMREVIAVARALDITFAPLSLLPIADIRALEHLPLRLATGVARKLGASFGPVPNYASTLQSIRRGQATEVDELNGRVAALGHQHGVATPVNRLLTALVHRVERTGEFLSPALLNRLIGP